MSRIMKSVQQHYASNERVLWLLEQFRQMVNDCIQIGLAENVTSLKSSSLRAYKQLSCYAMLGGYKLGAIGVATRILRNYRKAKRKNSRSKEPYAKRLHLTTCYGPTHTGDFKIEGGSILLPFKPKEPISIPLSQHILTSIRGFTIRSVTLTPEKLYLNYAKDVQVIQPQGFMGIDRNLNNVTTADSNGHVEQLDLSEATHIKAQCQETKRHMKRNDHRVRRQVFSKYGQIQRNKVQQILHHTSKQIVEQAKRNQYGIVMEKLTGMRKLYRKGNWQGKKYRGRMNSWSYFELQRQIEYKAKWEGLPVIYVPPYGTSSKCSICGGRMRPEENRMLRCPSCGYVVDRDVNAAKNILARGMESGGVRFAPIAPAFEAMVQEPAASAVILKVDADESNPRRHQSCFTDLTEPA